MFRDGEGGGPAPRREERREARNVLGEPLRSCSTQPMTGFFRDGCCNASADDPGSHTVCAVVSDAFLAFSKGRGNDLVTPRQGFPGLKDGDGWCLCAARWQEALEAGVAPPVRLAATHEAALQHCRLEDLKAHAANPG